MADRKIALFRNDGSSASVASADLPDLSSAREPVVNFGSLRKLQLPQGHQLRSKTSSIPVYTGDAVYWAVHDSPVDNTTLVSSVITVLRIERNLLTAGADRAGGTTRYKWEASNGDSRYLKRAETAWGCWPHTPDARPSVVVDGKIITVSCASGTQLRVCQRIADGSWAQVVAKTDNTGPYPVVTSLDRKGTDNEARSLVMFSGSTFHTSIIYTYRITSEPDNGSPLRIDTMTTANMLNLRTDGSLNWYKTTAESFIAGNDHAYTITHTEKGDGHTLLYFDFGGDGSFIYCRWIYLRKDGFIAPEDNEYRNEQKYGSSDGYCAVGNFGMHLEIAKGAPDIGGTPWCGPSARQIIPLTWYTTEKVKKKNPETGNEEEEDVQIQNLMLMWHMDLGLAGIAGKLNADGRIPGDWKWKNLKVFKRDDLGPSASYDLSGVLVGKDFC